MSGTTLDYALDVVMQLSPEQQDMLIEIVRKREIEAHRHEMARNARSAIEAFERGELQPTSVEDLIWKLHLATTRHKNNTDEG